MLNKIIFNISFLIFRFFKNLLWLYIYIYIYNLNNKNERRDNMNGKRGNTPQNNPRGAGWPSKTGNPSGAYRGNNNPKR